MLNNIKINHYIYINMNIISKCIGTLLDICKMIDRATRPLLCARLFTFRTLLETQLSVSSDSAKELNFTSL